MPNALERSKFQWSGKKINERDVRNSRYRCWKHQYPNSFAFQRWKIKKRRSIKLLALVFDFSFLILQVQNRTSLRVIKRSWAVACAKYECTKDTNRHTLKAQSEKESLGSVTRCKSTVCQSNLHPTASMALLINVDITTMPNPLPDTIKISTNSRFRLKYCATIKVEQSRVIPTPTPTTVP